MFTKILSAKEVEEFTNITNIKATRVFISKNNKYYYAIIIDRDIKLRISEKLAKKFI